MAGISSELIGLIGVVLGFTLGAGLHYLRYRYRIRRMKIIVREELKSAQAQLSQKRDILQQAIAKLGNHQILPTLSVHVLTSGYKSALGELYGHLNDRERNCLHVVYEYLRVGDEVTDRFETDILTALKEGVLADPYKAYADRFIEVLKMYEVAGKLIDSYLNGDPEEVYPLMQQ